MDGEQITLEPIPDDQIESIRPLWLQLAAHHWKVAPLLTAVAAPLTMEQSWQMRYRQYRAWSDEPGWLMLGANASGQRIGYAAARIMSAASSWDFGDRVGVLETLVVAHDHRRQGVGAMLFDAVLDAWGKSGVRTARVSVLSGNNDAARFYERRGAQEFLTNFGLSRGVVRQIELPLSELDSTLPGRRRWSHPPSPTYSDVGLSVYPARAVQLPSSIAVPSARTGGATVTGRSQTRARTSLRLSRSYFHFTQRIR